MTPSSLNGTYTVLSSPAPTSSSFAVSSTYSGTATGFGNLAILPELRADISIGGLVPVSANGTYYSITNNLAEPTQAWYGGATNISAYVIGMGTYINNSTTSLTVIAGNHLHQSNPASGSPITTNGLYNTDSYVNGSRGVLTYSGNSFVDPLFAFPALPNTAPDCHSYINTTDCMLNGQQVYLALTPTASGITTRATSRPAPARRTATTRRG